MAFKFNPFTGTFDLAESGGGGGGETLTGAYQNGAGNLQLDTTNGRLRILDSNPGIAGAGGVLAVTNFDGSQEYFKILNTGTVVPSMQLDGTILDDTALIRLVGSDGAGVTNVVGIMGIPVGDNVLRLGSDLMTSELVIDLVNNKLSTEIANYETLVTADNDIPNKKFVDDKFIDVQGNITSTLTVLAVGSGFDIEDSVTGERSRFGGTTTGFGFSFENGNVGEITSLRTSGTGLLVTDTINNTGLVGNADYSANYTDLTYTQKIYVDQILNWSTLTNANDTNALEPGNYKIDPSTASFGVTLNGDIGDQWTFADTNNSVATGTNEVSIGTVGDTFTDQTGAYVVGPFIIDSPETAVLIFQTGASAYDIIPLNGVTANLNNYQLLSEKGLANGYASLDAGGLVPVSQLPFGAPLYQGLWDANTNTPALVDGVGIAGQFYIVDVAGTQDLGSGNIAFSEGDRVIYNGTVWERNGASAVSWGSIIGTLSDQTDLQNALNTKEDTSNKVLNFVSPNNTTYPTTQAVQDLVSGLSGATNLSFTRDATTVTIESDTGTDAVLPAVSTTEAGVSTAADKTKLDGIEALAEVNNISDVNATDLTDGGDTDLHSHTEAIIVRATDLVTPITTTGDIYSFPLPYDFEVTSIKAKVDAAPGGSSLIIDIERNNVSMLSTLITIEATERSSLTAATQPVISTSTLDDDDDITVNINSVAGITTDPTGLTITLIGYRRI